MTAKTTTQQNTRPRKNADAEDTEMDVEYDDFNDY